MAGMLAAADLPVHAAGNADLLNHWEQLPDVDGAIGIDGNSGFLAILNEHAACADGLHHFIASSMSLIASPLITIAVV
jgi:hypothetical protein